MKSSAAASGAAMITISSNLPVKSLSDSIKVG
jgi:hypothetical protein